MSNKLTALQDGGQSQDHQRERTSPGNYGFDFSQVRIHAVDRPVIQKDEPPDAVKAAAEAKKKSDAITKIKLHGIIAVEDGSSAFNAAELDLVEKALAGLPVADKDAVKGAKIVRVTSLGADTAGRYSNKQSYDESGSTDEQIIELSDKAFGTAPAAESIRLITHEVGHAIASKPIRTAMSEEIKAGIKSNKLVEESNTAVGEFNISNDEYNVAVEAYNTALEEYKSASKGTDKDAIKTAKEDLAAKKAVMDKLSTSRTSKEQVFNAKKAASEAQKKDVAVKAAATKSKIANIDDLKKDAAAKLTTMEAAYASAGSTLNMDNAESADYRASVKSTQEAVKKFNDENVTADVDEATAEVAKSEVDNAIKERNDKKDALNKANPKNTVTSSVAALEATQDSFFKAAVLVAFNKSMNLAVRKFYDFVIKNNISPALTPYAEKNWPHKPEEFYAEAYSFFVTKPKELETYSKALYDWFKAGNYK
jgi:hypothetical protein